jgi:hypothetical protein
MITKDNLAAKHVNHQSYFPFSQGDFGDYSPKVPANKNENKLKIDFP